MRELSVLLLLFTGFSALAQKESDLIIKIDSSRLDVIVDEIGEKDIAYFLTTDSARRSPVRISRDKVWKIIYANKDVEVITTPSMPERSKALIPENTTRQNDSDPTRFRKKRNRFFMAGSLTRQVTANYYTGTTVYEHHPGFKIGYEFFAFNGKQRPNGKKSNSGFGIEANNFFSYHMEYTDLALKSESYSGSKHLVSPYIFREFDIKQLITIGIAAGPYGSVGRVTSASSNPVNPDQTAIKAGGGIHSSEYIQKYLMRNRNGLRSIYIRIGLDQYVTTESEFNGSFYVALGF